jgi:hypothetical protein
MNSNSGSQSYANRQGWQIAELNQDVASGAKAAAQD